MGTIKNQIKRRLNKLEQLTNIKTNQKVFLSNPPENDEYEVTQIEPVKAQNNKQILTKEEYEELKGYDNVRVIEVRWYDSEVDDDELDE